jgi:UDP-3-O-[3-hydroxymyristoyl] glucosamine N-acyltransferase
MDQRVEISKILEHIKRLDEDYLFSGSEKDNIKGFSSIFEYKPGTITWIRTESVFDTLKNNSEEPIRLLIAPHGFKNEKGCFNCIMTEDPHRVFFSILKRFYSMETECWVGTNNTISSTAKIAENVSIGHNCFIGDRVEIDEGTKILNNVVIQHDIKIGRNCFIQSGAVIGEDGFGFMTSKDQARERVKHFGTVIIGNNVEIGANTCIARGVIEDTIISDGSKIDNLCHIAHNVSIGKNAFIVANTMVGGSVTIENNCWLATSTIRNGVTIGQNAMVGFGAVVVKDVEPGEVVVGNPAKKMR